jgi:shikimate kinase/3-dehydroquinate synthase
MASGKSTIGRRVAELSGRRFIDLDQVLVERTGLSISDIFLRHGEPHFRRLEKDALGELMDGTARESEPPVISVGGGALLAREVRVGVLDRAIVVTLRARPEELARRARTGSERPLLAGDDPRERIVALLTERRSAYLEAHAVLDTDALAVDELAAAALEVWKRDPLVVAAGDRSYRVEIGSGLLDALLQPLVSGASRVVVVSNRPVMALHGETLCAALRRRGVDPVPVVLEDGEQYKTNVSLERIWQAAYENGIDRTAVVVALGGGVVTDTAGFAAACWMRGVRWVALPTTLLAMVDASVGGKTAVDFHAAKNCVGAFWQPSGVLCDVALESTEPERCYTSALAEVVKTALIGDPELFTLLERSRDAVRARDRDVIEELVRRSVRVKARVVSLDEREDGLRAVLNLGHTLGHALESAADYTGLTHGEAVSLGLVLALRIGERLKRTPAALRAGATQLLRDLGLPVDAGPERVRAAVALVGHDKKRTRDELSFIVATDVGSVEAVRLPLEELRALALAAA